MAEFPSMHDRDRSGPGQEFGSQMLEAALKTAVGAIIIIDEHSLIRTVNPATQQLFGYSETELIGQNVSMLMPEPFRSRHDGYVRRHLETGERKIIGIGRQVMGRRKTGAIFPIHLSVSAFASEGHRYFTGIVHDLSEQRTTGALREQALFEAIFNHLPDAVLVTDAEGKVVLCNPGVFRVFGYAPEELMGQGTAVLYATTAECERLRRIEAHLADKEALEPVTARYRRKSGEAFPAETVSSVLRDQRGQCIGLISLNRDISKQVEQDEALRKSQRMEAIGQLTGGIAHDFNNLLTIITGNHELLEMELTAPEQLDLLSRANNAAMMGARLTNRLLTFARRRRLDPIVLNLNEQVLAMAELLRRTLGETIALGTLLAPRLWSVRADPSEVENAVLNLAINSRDAMPGGGKLVIETANVALGESDVASEGGKPGEYVRLSVSDTGVGMSKDVLARVFEPFFTTKEPGKGTGLGLSVIYGFVQQSGGHVTICSEPGHGTTVTLYLPRIDAERDPAASAKQLDPAARARETVLLVEDNPDVRKVTARRLENLGYVVAEAASGARAVELLRSGANIHLVFSDVVMPGGMSGFELARWVRDTAPAVPVLLTSGFAADVARTGEAPASEHEILRKPYSVAELARALRRAIDGA
jgi:PAS domain S-box-containing protein